MSLNSPEGFKKTQKQIPTAGLQLAMCYAIIDLGTHEESYQGQTKMTPKVQFSFELPMQTAVFDATKGPQPMVVWGDYTVAAGDQAKLPKMLSSWGKGNKIEKITEELLKMYLGKPCTINIEHVTSKKDVDSETGKPLVFANIGLKGTAVFPITQGMAKPEKTVNPLIFFSLDSFSWDTYGKLPKHIQDKIAKSAEWPGILAKYPKLPTAAETVQNNQANTNTLPVETPPVSNPGGPVF